MMKKMIHDLELILFYKKWRNIEKNDFAYSIYRFLIINLIKKKDNFMQESNIMNIIAKLQWTCHVIIYKKILWKIKMIIEK